MYTPPYALLAHFAGPPGIVCVCVRLEAKKDREKGSKYFSKWITA